MSNSIRLLQHALTVVEERGQSYGDATTLFNQIAKRWSLTLGVEITASQVVLCMLDLKLARLSNDPTHTDSMVDVAGYAAVLAEVTKQSGGAHGR
jgi:hypothetical protein